MSNSNSEEEATASSLFTQISPALLQQQSQPNPRKKRCQPGNPDPDAEVIALSPKSLMATNRFVCEICNKGFQRDQNLQLHRRGHNLPWKLRQKSSKEVVRKRVYVCPEASCVHHQPSRALGDLTGIKKHYCRKHGEKKWRCEKCSKKYAVHSDWKAHVKTCGTREYRCDCGILFARKDSFITHRAFCDALAEESARLVASSTNVNTTPPPLLLPLSSSTWDPLSLSSTPSPNLNPNPNPNPNLLFHVKLEEPLFSSTYNQLPAPTSSSPHLSATALLQKAAMMGPTTSSVSHADQLAGPTCSWGLEMTDLDTWRKRDRLTRDFLGVADGEEQGLTSLNELGMDTASVDRSGDHTTKTYSNFGFELPMPTDDEFPCCL